MSSVASDRVFRSALGFPDTDYSMSFTDTSALLGGGTPTLLTKGGVYRFNATQTCHLAFHAASASATATTAKYMLSALSAEIITMPSDVYCACIRNTDNGTLVVTKMAESGLL